MNTNRNIIEMIILSIVAITCSCLFFLIQFFADSKKEKDLRQGQEITEKEKIFIQGLQRIELGGNRKVLEDLSKMEDFYVSLEETNKGKTNPFKY